MFSLANTFFTSLFSNSTLLIGKTKIVVPAEAILEEEKLVESKFEKMDEQDNFHTAYTMLYKVFEKYEKLYRLATKKLSEVE